MVWQAKKAGSTQLNFVPTHHWLPPRGGGANTADGGVGSFCLMTGSNGSPNCVPWTQDLVNQFKDGMSLCFAEALRQGFTLYVRPHLDDGTGAGAWRNGLLFRPAQKYGGFSYADIMLDPLADALASAYKQAASEQVLPVNPVVYFGLQGEMSATIMRYASDWGALTKGLRHRILGGSNLVTVKMGVGMNFNRLDDVTSTDQQFGSSRLSWLFWSLDPEGSGRGAPAIDTSALQALFASQLDFVGISAYAPVSGPGLRLQEFENSAFEFGDDMRSYGVDIAGLVNSGQLELQYSEFGIGGGNSYSGLTMARSPSEVALRPFFGVYGVYKSAEDPWKIPANKAFLREYYTKALQWLADPGNKTYKVSAAFIWSMNSWDVLGIYPESTSAQGTYEDPAIVDMVTQHNLRMRGQVPQPGDSGGAPAAAVGGAPVAAGGVGVPVVAPAGVPAVVVQAGK
jgi:hypothetical protein